MAISGPEGGPFLPLSFEYRVSASVGVVNYSVRTPSWLTATPNSGSADTGGVIIRFAVHPTAVELRPGVYGPAIAFMNVTNGHGSTTRAATLTVKVTISSSRQEARRQKWIIFWVERRTISWISRVKVTPQ